MSRSPRIGIVVLVALLTVAALHHAGSGTLGAPPVGSWSELDAWYGRSGPAASIVAMVRLAALAAAGWLVVAGGLQLVADGIASERLSSTVDAISPGFMRAISTTAAGMSVTVALALPVLPSGAAENPPGTAVMVPLDVPAPPSSSTTVAPTPSTATPPTTTTRPTTTPPTAVIARPSLAPEEVVVARGDSFWSIAVREARERDLVRYWHALIEANRDRLVDPSNPDLLYPGQVLRVP